MHVIQSRHHWRLSIVLSAMLLSAVAQAHVTVLHALDFGDVGAWKVSASDDARASLRKVPGADGRAGLCLDYRFPPGFSGYVSMARAWPLDFPSSYALRMGVRGHGPDNALQLKFVDAGGWNVWWMQRGEFSAPTQWTTLAIPQREVGFAWGPSADHTLRRTARVELTLAATHGGSGAVCFDRLEVVSAPPTPAAWPVPHATASVAQPGSPAGDALDFSPTHAWRVPPGTDASLTLDLGATRPLGGVRWHWLDGHVADAVTAQVSDDGHTWHGIRAMLLPVGDQGWLGLPGDPATRWLRLRFEGTVRGVALHALELQAPGWGAPVAMLGRMIRKAPRGLYPRGMSGEQNEWTVVGVDGGTRTGLISSDGRIEPFKGGWSVEPFLQTRDGLLDWADVKISRSLRGGHLPIPSVTWSKGPLQLRVTAFGKGTPEDSRLLARYVVRNNGDMAQHVTLALAVRPFQVNPPQQFLNTPGGFGPIHALDYRDGVLHVDHAQTLVTLGRPAGFVVGDLARQTLPQLLAASPRAQAATAHADGLTQGALLYPLEVPAHGEATVGIDIPWTGAAPAPVAAADAAAALLRQDEAAVATAWQARLQRVRVQLPPQAQDFQQTLYSAMWQILLDRDGPALRPGTRSYARSWIRDGAMMSEALLRMGDAQAVHDYLLWYAPHQFGTGKVPCCVDWKGSDPTPENDSQGELIFAIAEYTRYTHDLSLARQLWPHVEAAVRYMDRLRATQMTPAYREGQRRLYYGLMPRSISHEGYSAKPMHSYWDDFWSLRGYRDAAWLAGQLGHTHQQQAITRDADGFQKDFFASIEAAARWHHIDYIAGCADLGDFDPTSTTIALSPVGVQHELPQALLHATFARYWRDFEERAHGSTAWKSYTPYEWRNVDAFVRLGWRTRIPALLDFFFAGQHPAAWHQWAEVVWHDPEVPHFIGDMPHGWVASDFLRSALDMLAYRRYRDEAMVLAAGVPASWLEDGGIHVDNLRTPWGRLSYHLWRTGDGDVRLDVPAGTAVPPGGLVLTWPGARAPGVTTLDGRVVQWHDGELRIDAVPAQVRVRR